MTSAAFRILPPSCASLAALLLAACGGSPDAVRVAAPGEGAAVPEAADGGTPQEEPAGATAPSPEAAAPQPTGTAPRPTETITPPDRPAAPAVTPTTNAAGEKGSQCEAMRAVKFARPLFERPPLPCERADRIVYHRRGGGGACGPSTALALDASGAVAIETTDAGDAPASGLCPSPRSARAEITPSDARRLIASSCATFNAGYSVERGIGCEAAAIRLYFFEGGGKLGETAALPCSPHALDRVVAELDALAAQLD